MSAICGIVNLNGEPVDPSMMEHMMTALTHLGPDDSRIVIDGAVAFGHQMFFITPDSLLEKLPFHNTDSQLMITTDIRLDNRDELISTLCLAPSNLSLTDSFLVLKAYEKWGASIVDHLLGDYSIAIWDGGKRELVLITDVMGMRPLFYYRTDKQFIFSTEIKGIHAIASIPKQLNKKVLAMHLADMATLFLLPEATFFQNILAMPAASIMRVNSNTIQSHRYWIPDVQRKIQFKNEDDWIEAFQELFFRAVDSRLRSAFPVVSLLSGGLDSSSVSATAAQILKKRGKYLHTFSAVLPEGYQGTGIDERHYINCFKTYDSINMHYLSNQNSGPFDNLERLIWSGETPLFTSRHYLYTDFSRHAESLKARLVLDGCYGEMGPSFHGDGYLAELLLKGRFFRLSKEIFLKSRVEKRRILGILKREILKPLLPLSLQARLAPRFDLNQMSQNLAVQNEFIDKWAGNQLHDLYKEANSIFYQTANHRKNQIGPFDRKMRCRMVSAFTGYEKTVFCFPFADRRIVEFCLASPGWMKIRNGYKRYMIRSGMKSILPDGIRWRTSKEPFSPDYHDRYNRQKRKAEELMSKIKKNDPIREIIDVEKGLNQLGVIMRNNRCSTPQEFSAMHVAPAIVYLSQFLRQFDEYRNEVV